MATSQREEKIEQFQSIGIEGAVFSLGQSFPIDKLRIDKDTTIILTLPPGRRNRDLTVYESAMRKLITQLASQQPAHAIFVSTTAVCGGNSVVTETSQVSPQTTSGRIHVTLEQVIAEQFAQSYTVLRLAGLTGPDRHPIYSIAGRNLSEPNRVVNLVHSHDVVKAMQRLISLGPQNRILHLCAPDHPQRGLYYSYCARELSLPTPDFGVDINGLQDSGKRIDASDSLRILGMDLSYPSPYQMLPKQQALTD